jgi:hypothetical protein
MFCFFCGHPAPTCDSFSDEVNAIEIQLHACTQPSGGADYDLGLPVLAQFTKWFFLENFEGAHKTLRAFSKTFLESLPKDLP